MKVPETLEECFVELEKFLSEEELEGFKATKEDDLVGCCHFGLGMWIRNNWGLWHDSPLVRYFKGIGVDHPDDMSAIILTSFHRYLNGKEIKLEEQIGHYQEYWRKAKEKNGSLEQE